MKFSIFWFNLFIIHPIGMGLIWFDLSNYKMRISILVMELSRKVFKSILKI